MVKQALLTIAILCFIGTASSVSAQTSGKQVTTDASKKDYKFLDDITIDPAATTTDEKPVEQKPVAVPAVKKDLLNAAKSADGNVETAGSLQIKYSLLLDVEVEMIKNINLFKLIDEWYGTPYSFGGTSKKGIDCSAFMQILFTALYGISLPRTAQQQYDFSRRISRTELKEGDLLFFNTIGGVSHVGMYLQNNKFVHASTSGVTISDMFDPYYSKRLVGVGRVLDSQSISTSISTTKP